MAGYTLLTLIVLAALAVSIRAIVDAASTPPEAFSAAGSSKRLWVLLLIFFTVALDLVGVFLVIAYFAFMRPRVRTAVHS